MELSGANNTAGTKEASASSRRATFFGTAYHKVSERNQVAIPRHLIKVIEESHEGQLLLVRWMDEKFLRLYTQTELDGLIARINNHPELTAEEKNTSIRTITGNAEPIEPDKQGRFVLPGQWVSALNLTGEVAFFGAHTRIEIWPAGLRREMEHAEQARTAQTAKKISDLML